VYKSASKKPWLKSYRLARRKLAPSLKPYPVLPLYHILDQSVRNHPGAVAIDYCGAEITYRELKRASESLSRALFRLGVKKGDRVATVLPACPQYIISNFAILKAGAVHVPCSTLHKDRELAYEIGLAGVKTVICLEDDRQRFAAMRRGTRLVNIICTSLNDYSAAPPRTKKRLPPGSYRFRRLIAACEPVPPRVAIDPRADLAYLAFTGGATGTPKGVMLTHFNRYANILQGLPWMMAGREKTIRGRASVCIAVPLFHAYGDAIALFAIYWGLRIILIPDSRDIDYIVRVMAEKRPFLVSMVPSQLMELRDRKLPPLPVQIMSGASYLPTEVRESITQRKKIPVSIGYGLTETSPITHMDMTGTPARGIGPADGEACGIGLPVPDTEVKLVDERTGRECGPRKPGHMYIKGPQVMKGYWPKAGSGLAGGWLATGDIAWMDEAGRFYLVDPIKDMANISGYKVYTSTIDEILHRHPGVAMAVAVGVPDPEREGSERIKAFVVLKDKHRGKITDKEIIAFCRDRCAPYAVPRWVEFRDSLPLTATEKIFKRRLREEEIRKMRAAGLLK
jgi:long-chain acyl-CoA synthetase